MFKIIYITEAGKKVGFGHLKRSSSIKNLIPNCYFDVVLEYSHSLDWEHDYNTWDSLSSLSSLIEKYDVVIFDSFQGTQQTYDDLEQHHCVIYIDDYVRHPIKKGLVIDWTVGAENRKPMGDAYCFGVEYLVTRPQFYKPKSISFREEITNIATIFGGSDPFDMSYQTEKLLKNNTSMNIKHIGTQLYPSYSKFKNDNRFYWDLSDNDYANCLASSDIVITSGGQTLYELASLGVPAIAVSVTTNQEEDINGFGSLGSCKVLSVSSIRSIVSLLESLSMKDRINMSRASSGVDGRGIFLKQAINEFIYERITT